MLKRQPVLAAGQLPFPPGRGAFVSPQLDTEAGLWHVFDTITAYLFVILARGHLWAPHQPVWPTWQETAAGAERGVAAARQDNARRDRGSLWPMDIVTDTPFCSWPFYSGAARTTAAGAGRGVATARQDDAQRDRGSLWPVHSVTETPFAAGPSSVELPRTALTSECWCSSRWTSPEVVCLWLPLGGIDVFSRACCSVCEEVMAHLCAMLPAGAASAYLCRVRR